MRTYSHVDSKCMVVVMNLPQMEMSDCDTDGTAVLQYGKGRRAVLNYAMDKFYDQTATIMGTKGVINVSLMPVINHGLRLEMKFPLKNSYQFPDRISDWMSVLFHRLT